MQLDSMDKLLAEHIDPNRSGPQIALPLRQLGAKKCQVILHNQHYSQSRFTASTHFANFFCFWRNICCIIQYTWNRQITEKKQAAETVSSSLAIRFIQKRSPSLICSPTRAPVRSVYWYAT